MGRFRKWALAAADAAVFYAALAGTLLIRYGADGWSEAWAMHAGPFFIIFCVWMASLYIANLYRYESFRNARLLIRNLGGATAAAAIVSVVIFYIFSATFGLMPKTNLILFAGIYFVLGFTVRTLVSRIFSGSALRTALLGKSKIADEVAAFLGTNSGVGYAITARADIPFRDRAALEAFVRGEHPEIIVVEEGWIADPAILSALYELLGRGIRIIPLLRFYETIFERIPIEEIEERWFVENISPRRPSYEALQRIIDIIGSLVIGIILLPVAAIASIAIVLTSPGPAIYAQVRVGRGGERFTMYKFRTMRADAEKNGPQWAAANDDRTTPVGRFLRHTHLDEIPQLWNILMGKLSFVGPRPERPEFAEEIAARVPFFRVRNFVKPGLTGWAQINYRYTSSIEDAKEKLAYDVFYIKHRSTLLDVLIVLKTAKRLLVKA